MNIRHKITITILSISLIIYTILYIGIFLTLNKHNPNMAVAYMIEDAIDYADNAADFIKTIDIKHSKVLLIYRYKRPQSVSIPDHNIPDIFFMTFKAQIQYALLPHPIDVVKDIPVMSALNAYNYVVTLRSLKLPGDCFVKTKTFSEWVLYKKVCTTIKGVGKYANSVQPSFSIYVTGAVKNCGNYTIYYGARLINAFGTHCSILTTSDLGKVIIIRDGKVIKVNLLNFINTHNPADNPLLMNGDIIYLPGTGERINLNRIKQSVLKLTKGNGK